MADTKHTNGNARPCSNCSEDTRLDQAITVYAQNRLIAVLCPGCQQAKKIQVTLERKKQWKFSQYFPVEG